MGLDTSPARYHPQECTVSISVEMWGGFRPEGFRALALLLEVSISVEMWGGFRLDI